MQYLLLDAHHRFLGLLNSQRAFSVGDTFENKDEQTFAVVGLNWSGGQGAATHSLTVIPISGVIKPPTPEAN
jgi:hypothetical protein